MTVVGILGTLHDEKMREAFNYSLERMKKIMDAFRPDIICGEIRPEDWQLHLEDPNYSGYLGPSEYRGVIIEYCLTHNVEFCPIDWFEDDLIQLDYTEDKTILEIDEFEAKMKDIMESYMRIGSASALAFNSVDYNEIVKKKQDTQLEFNPKLHHIYWTARNQVMVKRIIKVIEDNPNKRILCTVGAEHCYFFCEGLSEHEDVDVVFPLNIEQ